MMTTLVTGGSGSLGSELQKIFPDCLSPSSKDLDITNKESIENYLKNHDIDIIIHTAAITSVRLCEENKTLAWNTNVKGTKNLVDCVLKLNSKIKFVYVSTACVFDGNSGMYDEDDIPYPENFYALTKLLGESEISKLSNSVIVRTNFVSKKPWPYPAAFTDRFGTYLFASNVAIGIKEILENDLCGFVHIVGNKKISMYELAKITTPNVLPMKIDEYDGPSLTMDMSLDSKRWKKYSLN
jgi:dTDP-4-dehydrorhamnose reductase